MRRRSSGGSLSLLICSRLECEHTTSLNFKICSRLCRQLLFVRDGVSFMDRIIYCSNVPYFEERSIISYFTVCVYNLRCHDFRCVINTLWIRA